MGGDGGKLRLRLTWPCCTRIRDRNPRSVAVAVDEILVQVPPPDVEHREPVERVLKKRKKRILT